MKDGGRAAIAYIAGCLITSLGVHAIVDRSTSRYIQFSGKVTPTRVHIFDYAQKSYITGNGNGTRLSLFNYGENSHLSLTISGDRFRGFDYGTGSHFRGRVRGRLVQLYDFAKAAYFGYSL